jgi:hypothetical protein
VATRARRRAFERARELAERRRLAYALLAAAVVLPRLVVLVAERGQILLPYTYGEKSDDFARTFVDSGTFGFVAGIPSAYTQPLYSFFLIPLYATLGRSWEVVGGAQILVAVGVAALVYETGRRWLSPQAGVVAALLATLHPYVVWHDVHVNRELLDALLAAAIVFLTLALASTRSPGLAAGLGVILGLAILGNVRLAALPLVLAVFLVWHWRLSRRSFATALLSLGVCAAVVVPWIVRNRVEVGCFALTTDARALWEANNERTLDTLRAGLWIDNVPLPAGFPPSAQDASRAHYREGRRLEVDECAQMRFYRERVLDFWREHPGEKARLAAQASWMLWNPSVTPSDTRGVAEDWLNTLRASIEPVYMVLLYALALWGLTRVPRLVAALALTLLAYQWLMAMVFVGATRYRVPWDIVLALLAGAALVDLAARVAQRQPAPASPGAGTPP